MPEENLQDKLRMIEEEEIRSPTGRQFGPEQIMQMNQELPDSTITLYLMPDFDKKLLPVKARQLRNWWEEDEKTRMHARFCLPLTMASGVGYYILSPATFTVEWDGEENHDCEVTIHDAATHAAIDNHSSFGSFTVQARFIVRTKNLGDFIYVKGVANQTRQPFHVMEAMIESWWSPSEFGIVCLVNQPGKFTIKKGEPLAQMFVVNSQQAQYGLGVVEGYPPLWKEWTDRRDPAIYDGRNMDYLRGVLPDQTPVCPHMKSWSKAQVNAEAVESEKTVDSLMHAGNMARFNNHFEDAERLYMQAVQLAESKNEVSDDLMTNLLNLGFDMQRNGKLPHSVRLMRKWVELSERYYPPGLPETSDVFTDIAWTHRAMGEFESAADILRESLRRKRAENIQGKNLAKTLIALGTLYDFRGKRAEAKLLLTEARKIYEEILAPDDPEYLYLKNVYGCLLTHIGEYEEAEKLYREVVESRTRLYGADSLDIAFTYNDLGYHYKETKDWDNSEKYFLMCIENRQKHHGATDLEVVSAHDDLSWMYREKGDLKKAIEQLRIILSIQEAKLSPKDEAIRQTLSTMSELYEQLGDRNASEAAAKRAASI